MDIAAQYAKALCEVGTPDARALDNLRQALKRRGHEKLLPRIFSEYKKLLLGRERAQVYREVTPQMRRTGVLLQLYQKLIRTK